MSHGTYIITVIEDSDSLCRCIVGQLYLTPPRSEDCTCNGLDWVIYLCWLQAGIRLSHVESHIVVSLGWVAYGYSII